MKYYCNPLNLEYRYQLFKLPGGEGLCEIHREAADPSLILFKDTYYLFPSMTAGFFTSSDLVNWQFHRFRNDMPVYDYAPDVRAVGEYLYFCASKRDQNCSFFRTKDPINEPFEEIEGSFPFWDPNLFVDEDGRFYFYWGCSNVTPIYGVELDPHTMKPLSEPIVMFDSNEKERGYERNGEDHVPPKTEAEIEATVQGMLKMIPEEMRGNMPKERMQLLYAFAGNRPYIEGAWMTKHEGQYYLQYAIPGTQYNVYGDGVYVSDRPLGPFVPAKNNPYSYEPGGFITGAGHGSTLEDKEGRFWHTSTMRISKNHSFERRLGLWKAGFDEDGELYCDQRFGDWPIDAESAAWEKPRWMLLSYGKEVQVSSGEGAANVVDEDIRTWWRADGRASGEWVQVDLGKEQEVHGVQINFADYGMKVAEPEGAQFFGDMRERRWLDEKVQPARWVLEGSLDGITYFMLQDKSQVTTDYAHDFLVWEEGIHVRYLKLTVLALPYGQEACVSGLRVFGKGQGQAPARAALVKAAWQGDLDMQVSWKAEDAVGCNILWGHKPQKLYHSYLVYGRDHQKIGALVKGEPVYIRVDTFNEAGITEGEVIQVRA